MNLIEIWHYHRPALAKIYLDTLNAGLVTSTTIFAPRRAGKTSFLLKDLTPAIDRQANRERWIAHVSAWRQSGRTQVAYCRLHGLVPETFSAWVARVKKMSIGPLKPLTMVPVVIQPAAMAVELSSPLRLQHRNGWELDVPAGTAADWLGKVLKESG